jgi:threonine/homoserine/homoserine lactone efflux protein
VDGILLVEVFFAVYAAIGTGMAIANGNFGPLFLLITSLLGFGYVVWLGIQEVPFLAIWQQRRSLLKNIKNARQGRDLS